MWIKIIIIVAFIGIVISLGSALFSLSRNKKNSNATVKALTYRVGISLGLFIFLMILAFTGVIKPHGVIPNTATNQTSAQ